MSKERPFKSFKTPSERPFKTYNPGNPSSMLFQDPQQQHPSQQPLRLGGTINGLMHHQQTQQHQQQQQQHAHEQQQHSQHMSFLQQQQVYPDPDDYLQLGVQRGQNPIMNIDPSLSQYYEDLGLDDTDNPLIRPELLVTNESILQREQDLNIGQATTGMPSASNFIIPNRHVPRSQTALSHTMGGEASPNVSLPDSLSMLFDQSPQSLSPFSSTLQQQQQQLLMTKAMGDRSGSDISNGSHFLNSIMSGGQVPVPGMMVGVGSHGSNGRSATLSTNDILPSSSGITIEPFPVVKREADEGRSLLSVGSPSPNGMQSPTQSDSFGESPKRGLQRSVSNSSTGSISQSQGDQGKSDGGSSENGDKPDPKDPAYLEKRRKNNESAKRSREARRNKEELVALRVITLEEENMKLRAEINLLDKELDELRARLFT